MKQAYNLSLGLSNIFEKTKDKLYALARLAKWHEAVRQSGFKAFNTISRSIQCHYQTILNYFDNRSTNASAESFNAKIKAFRSHFLLFPEYPQLAADVNIPYTSYNKIENGSREITIEELEQFASYFGMTIDQVVHFDARPVDVTIQDKPNFEQINLINQLDEEDRTVVFKIIDTMLTKKKFKDFFQQNAAAL